MKKMFTPAITTQFGALTGRMASGVINAATQPSRTPTVLAIGAKMSTTTKLRRR